MTDIDGKRALLERIQTEGLAKAYAGLLRVLDDDKAGASATASAANTIFRAGGLLDSPEDASDKEPSEMSHSEIQASLARLRKEWDERAGGPRE